MAEHLPHEQGEDKVDHAVCDRTDADQTKQQIDQLRYPIAGLERQHDQHFTQRMQQRDDKREDSGLRQG